MPRSLATTLGDWAADVRPGAADEELARSALIDTVCVALAARRHPVAELAGGLGRAG
ncbi:MAG: hypothetical protein JO244_12485, partial [Solirubrobacterales bacterium]|nr:hypothetical protein [Solirubrobacterales bacterium]